MNKNMKVLAIIIIIICILCIIGIIIIRIRNKETIEKNKELELITKENQDESEIKIEYELSKVKNATHFFTVESCIQEAERNSDFVATKMKVLYSDRVYQFLVSGYKNENISDAELYYIVLVDTINNTYEVIPLKDQEYTSIDNIDIIKSPNEIKNKGDNTFEYKRILTEDLCRIYLKYYLDLSMNNSEKAYNLLDDKYREKRFENLNEFKKYIDDARELIEQTSLAQYSEPEINEEITTYILKDQFNHYYIIEEDSIMNIKIKLDEYTITSEDYKNKYEELKESEKTSANLGIFIQMVNNRDYKHAYEKLSPGFKNNYFKTQVEFENYVKNNWYTALGYEINQTKNEGNIYIYQVTLRNLKGKEVDTKEEQFNIRLNEEDNTDFEISFNIEL